MFNYLGQIGFILTIACSALMLPRMTRADDQKITNPQAPPTAPNAAPKEAPETAPKDEPQIAPPKDESQTVPKDEPQTAPKDEPEAVPKKMPQTTPTEAPQPQQTTPQAATQTVPKEPEQTTPQAATQTVPKEPSQTAPTAAPNAAKSLKTAQILPSKTPTADQRIPDYLWDLRMQLAGHISLGVGFGATLVGITLIEIDSWGDIGKAGFITAAAGTGIAIAGMFLAGFSHPVHLKKKKR